MKSSWTKPIHISSNIKSDLNISDMILDTRKGYPMRQWRQYYSQIPELVEQIYSQIQNRTFQFPFQSRFIHSSSQLFQNYISYTPKIINEPYELCGYYGREDFSKQIPRSIQPDQQDYFEMDVLSDCYFENQRIRARKYNTNSLWSHWCSRTGIQDWVTYFWNVDFISFKELRDYLYTFRREVKPFRLSWIKGIFSLLFDDLSQRRRILDMSSGWGDRLIASIGMGYEYTGYDPNPHLQSGYRKIIEQFGNPHLHRVHCQPFEKSDVPVNHYDVCLSSPPFYDQEIYNTKDPNQSIANYPQLSEWIENFLYIALEKIYHAVKSGGYISLHLADTPRYQICDPMIQFYKQYSDLQWWGIIGVSGCSSRATPVWIWKKL